MVVTRYSSLDFCFYRKVTYRFLQSRAWFPPPQQAPLPPRPPSSSSFSSPSYRHLQSPLLPSRHHHWPCRPWSPQSSCPPATVASCWCRSHSCPWAGSSSAECPRDACHPKCSPSRRHGTWTSASSAWCTSSSPGTCISSTTDTFRWTYQKGLAYHV